MNKKWPSFIFIIILFTSALWTACRKDDICTQAGTPKLGAGFYDFNAPNDFKTAENFTLIALPQNDTLLKNVDVDSIHIPLDVNNDQCRFIFSKDQNNDTILFTYQRDYIFISKSCGYKSHFHQLNIDILPDNNPWVKQIDILNTDITTDTINVKIYH